MLMEMDQVFLQDILAHPEEDGHRLIYADWLNEQGGRGDVERAEFIRVQCSLGEREREKHTGFQDDPACPISTLLSREKDLLQRWFWEWFGNYESPLAGAWPGSPAAQINQQAKVEIGYFARKDRLHWTLTLRRGFVQTLALPYYDLRSYGDQLLTWQPLQEVLLTTLVDSFPLREKWPTLRFAYVWQMEQGK
jgi:uncharacterized protein (TIGR02996 family)